ncbi:MAG: helicase, partial [Gemmataceae bacterium]|nr:helicase [Gemmataceae bacterium]
YDWTQGAGPKLRQMLLRGVGVHHAGVLPKYRRVVEELFAKKLLSVAVCTETLAAGINLPARSVIVTSLAKGPLGKQKLIDASTLHQIFGRAGRPQYDKEGFVYVLAHEDDVRLLRWKEKYDAIPETTKDPVLLKMKKELKRKKPTKRDDVLYWTEGQFEKLKNSPPARLYSKGPLPWRLLAYLLKVSPEVDKVRTVIRKRLLDQPRIAAGEKALERMLLTLEAGGYVTLEPPAPIPTPDETGVAREAAPPPRPPIQRALPTDKLDRLLVFRSVHPLYGAFLVEQLGIASPEERLQAFESVLELPRPLLKFVRVPRDLTPGRLERERLDPELIRRGLITAPIEDASDSAEGEGGPKPKEFVPWEERPPLLAEKLRMYFEALYPEVTDLQVEAVWSAAELLRFGGDFNAYIKQRDLTRQEGIIFRHLLRLILLCAEFAELTPPETTTEEWREWLRDVERRLAESCRKVDPTSTDLMIQAAKAADVVEGEEAKPIELPEPPPEVQVLYSSDMTFTPDPEFGAGIFDE